MKHRFLLSSIQALCLAAMLAACGGDDPAPGGGGTAEPPAGPAWLNHGRDPQRSGVGGNVAAQALGRMAWRTDVDLAPVRGDDFLNSGHYGSPIISGRNTVILPVKTVAAGRFRIEARDGDSGALKWQSETDFVPPDNKFAYSVAGTAAGRVYFPGIGGKLYYRDQMDAATPGPVETVYFYGADKYAANKAELDAGVIINTLVTTDTQGNAFFGFSVASGSPAGLAGGLVRVDPAGKASWVSLAQASGDDRISRMAPGSGVAVSLDGKTVYAVLTSWGLPAANTVSYLAAFDAATLQLRSKIALADPASGRAVAHVARSTATPLVAPDGDVYFGVTDSGSNHNSAGWLLRFDAALTTVKTPGGFGWDMTPTVVPASAVSAYTGPSSYLLAVKYNSYLDGQHRMALLDPAATQNDRFLPAVTVMKEVITILSPTRVDPADPYLHEWCINAGAFDPNTRSLFINNSDGYLYRWNLASNTLAERFNLNSGYFQSYTPTLLGPDGKVYAINNAMLTAVGK